MSQPTTLSFPAKTIGLDLGDRTTAYTTLGPTGDVVARGKIATTQAALAKLFADERGTRVAFEAGTHSPWISRQLQGFGCEVIVANPWRLQLISKSLCKTDPNDADTIAEFAYLKPSVLSPITHRGLEGIEPRAALNVRDAMVSSRTQLINCARGIAKSFGEPLPSCSAESFPTKVWIPDSLKAALLPLKKMVATLNDHIREFDRYVEDISKREYPETGFMRQVSGVGPITALRFVLTIEDPKRFEKSRHVGSYVGLVPRLHQSSRSDPELRITKAGDRRLRTLLVQCSHRILSRLGPDSDLQRHGLRIASGGGKNAKKRAVIAVARKLAVLLHRLWITGETYEPLRNSSRMNQSN